MSLPLPRDDRSAHRYSTVAEAKVTRRSGRGIRRLITLCGTVTQLVAENDRRLIRQAEYDSDADNDDDDDSDEADENLPPEKREELKR